MTVISMAAFGNKLYEGALHVAPGAYREWMLDQLRAFIPAAGALWRRGRAESDPIHSLSMVGLSRSAPTVFSRNRELNPLFGAMRANQGQALILSNLVSRESLRASRLYSLILQPFEIEHMMGLMVLDTASGLETEITVFRPSSQKDFDATDAEHLRDASFYLMGAASHASFLAQSQPQAAFWDRPSAVVDASGRLYEAQTGFLEMLVRNEPEWRGRVLPFELPAQPASGQFIADSLNVYYERQGDLCLVRIWERNPLDGLTNREREIALAIATGRSYKLVARDMGLSASTVANHLQRIYAKLRLDNRNQLSELVNGVSRV